MSDKNHDAEKGKQKVREQEITEKLNVYQEEIFFQNKELLRSKEALERSKESYKELFNKAPAGYIIYSNNNELIKVNKVFANMLEKYEEEILGTLITDHIDHKEQDNFYFHKKNLLKENKIEPIYLTINQLDVIAISNLIEIDNEKHIKTILIQLPQKQLDIK